MDERLEKIWNLALPYLEQGVRKDFVVHTQGVVEAMQRLLEKEPGDKGMLLAAAMLHDVGWAKVPQDIQKNWKDKEDQRKGEELHLEYAGEIIQEILSQVQFPVEKVERVIEIVRSHKFQDPAEHDKRLLIDADNLSDILKEPFYADVKAYGCSAKEYLQYRRNNSFYTQAAQEIFEKEFQKREKEIGECHSGESRDDS